MTSATTASADSQLRIPALTGSVRQGRRLCVPLLRLLTFVAGWLILPSAVAHANGLDNPAQGPRLGSANAGAEATSGDASSAWWNPATMVHIHRRCITASAAGLIPSARFDDGGSTRSDVPFAPFLGSDGRSEDIIPVPAFCAVIPGPGKWRFGLSCTTPFGLSTDWGDKWIGRYYADESTLQTFAIRPSIAVPLTDSLALGGGIDVTYASASLSNAVDFGAALGVPQGVDGNVRIDGTGWAVGFDLGLLFSPREDLHLGATYRSRTSFELRGPVEFDLPLQAQPLAAATGRFGATQATTDLVMPDVASLGAAWDVSGRTRLLASVVWTNWSLIKDVPINFENPAEPDATLAFRWKDTIRVAVGAEYLCNERLLLRGGVAWDPTPVPDDTRTPRIPPGDGIWAAVGASFQVNSSCAIDFAYAHQFIEGGNIRQEDPASGNLRGTVHGYFGVISLGVSLNL